MEKIVHAFFVYFIINLLCFVGSYFMPIYDKSVDMQGVGSAVCGFSGTILGILITIIILVVTLKGDHIQKYKEYGYMKFFISLYASLVINLILMFILGFFCFFREIEFNILLPIISISLSSFIMLILILIITINMSFMND